MPGCVDYGGRLPDDAAYRPFPTPLIVDAEIDPIVVNEPRGDASSVKASFIYIVQSASRSHRRRGDRGFCAGSRSTRPITFTSAR